MVLLYFLPLSRCLAHSRCHICVDYTAKPPGQEGEKQKLQQARGRRRWGQPGWSSRGELAWTSAWGSQGYLWGKMLEVSERNGGTSEVPGQSGTWRGDKEERKGRHSSPRGFQVAQEGGTAEVAGLDDRQAGDAGGQVPLLMPPSRVASDQQPNTPKSRLACLENGAVSPASGCCPDN